MKLNITSILMLICVGCFSAQTGFALNNYAASNTFENLALSTPSKTLNQGYETDVRPFITDDARVVGERLAQLETWLRIDKESGQQWIMGAYGPNKKTELTIGGVYGYQVEHDKSKKISYALPLLQAKFLFKEYTPNKAPGFGMVIGSFLPVGKGSFKPAGYGTFAYLTATQSFGDGDAYLFHGNLGANYLHIKNENDLIATWGIGTQIKTYKGFHLVGEVFSGDPYIPGTGMAFQGGYRYFFNDLVQIDMTAGKGLSGKTIMPFWFSVGIRIVTERFLKTKNEE